MTSGVYIMTNKENGCRYIGYSSDIEWRWGENKRELQMGTFGKNHQKFIDDYQEFGEESFIYGIIEVTINDDSLMSKKAEEWKKIIQPEYNKRM